MSIPGLDRKYKIRVEVTNIDKHPSLLRYRIKLIKSFNAQGTKDVFFDENQESSKWPGAQEK